jgi:hypothetical protein
LTDDIANTDTSSADPQVTTTGSTETSATDIKVDSSVQAEGKQTEDTGEPKEDTFFDPKQVPEELLPAYKGMQAAFTKKTQEIAQARKEAEGFKTKAESYDKVQHLIPIVEEMLASKKQTQDSPEMTELVSKLKEAGYSEEAIEMMKIGAQFTLNQFNQSQGEKEAQTRFESGVAEAEKLDPRLNDESLVYKLEDGKTVTFGQMVGQLTASNPKWTENPVEFTKQAIRMVDALIGSAKKEGKEELSNSATAKAKKFPSVTSSPQSAASDAAPKSIHEAAELAKAEIGTK